MVVIKYKTGIRRIYALYLSIMKKPVMQALRNDPYLYRMYYFDTSTNEWKLADYTDVNLEDGYVWGVTEHFTDFMVMSTLNGDTDGDGLTDYYEISTHPYTLASENCEKTPAESGWVAIGHLPSFNLENNGYNSQHSWKASYSSHIKSPEYNFDMYKNSPIYLEFNYRFTHGSSDQALISISDFIYGIDYGYPSFEPVADGQWHTASIKLFPNAYPYYDIEHNKLTLEFFTMHFFFYENGDSFQVDNIELFRATSPYASDTDGDGLTDGQEVLQYGTSPVLQDTDGEGWNDWDEINTYKTNPILTDTDGDGVMDSEDMNPLVDLKITFKVKEIVALDELEGWGMGDADFYLWVGLQTSLGTEWEKTTEPIVQDSNHISPNLDLLLDLNDKDQYATIIISLWDDDGDVEATYDDSMNSGDDLCDISSRAGGGNKSDEAGSNSYLHYCLRNGQWMGDDHLIDSNGYGHVSGNEDGSTDTDEDDCELWFDITMNDNDGDGLAYWEEVNVFNTDPTIKNIDSDEDMIPDWYERKYCLYEKPELTWMQPSSDNDGDGLTNHEEYILGTEPRFGDARNLYYRVVDVSESSFNTTVRRVTYEERARFDDEISLSGVSPAGTIHYPAIGNPALVSLEEGRSFDIYIDTFVSSGWSGYIKNIKTGAQYSLSFSQISSDSVSGLIHGIATIGPVPPAGLYDLFVIIDGATHSVPHAVGIYEKFDDDFKFVHITDVHIGRFSLNPLDGNDKDNVGDFLSIINRINKVEKPDFVVITGDLTDDGSENKMKYFKACLLKFDVPVFVIPGNHDYMTLQGFPYLDSLLWSFYPTWSYANYINPWLPTKVNSETSWGYDYSFDYGNYHFIMFDSGWNSWPNPDGPTVAPPYMSGLTSDQLAWMKEDQKNACANGKNHTFVFTHAPIVGHGGKMTHDVPFYENGEFARLIDHDRPFVEWVNGQDSDYPEGQYVEAVFVGHTHLCGGYKKINVDNMNMEKFNLDTGNIPFTWATVYIETTTATKNG